MGRGRPHFLQDQLRDSECFHLYDIKYAKSVAFRKLSNLKNVPGEWGTMPRGGTPPHSFGAGYAPHVYKPNFQITFKKDSKLHNNVFSAIKKVGHRAYLSAKTAFLVDIGHIYGDVMLSW